MAAKKPPAKRKTGSRTPSKSTTKPTTPKRRSSPTRPRPDEEANPARRARIEGLKQELFGDFLTAAEVAEILEVHPRTVGEYIRDGRLRGIQLGGGWRISEEALRAFVKTIAELPKETTRGNSMFSRFTDRARRVVVLAQEEARLLNHNYIGTEHILLGVLSEGKGVGAKALIALGVSLDDVRQDVETTIGTGTASPVGHIPFTPKAKKVMELSLREALQLGHNYIGTEHILLALLREGEGVAWKVLVARGVEEGELKNKVIELLSSYSKQVWSAVAKAKPRKKK